MHGLSSLARAFSHAISRALSHLRLSSCMISWVVHKGLFCSFSFASRARHDRLPGASRVTISEMKSGFGMLRWAQKSIQQSRVFRGPHERQRLPTVHVRAGRSPTNPILLAASLTSKAASRFLLQQHMEVPAEQDSRLMSGSTYRCGNASLQETCWTFMAFSP